MFRTTPHRQRDRRRDRFRQFVVLVVALVVGGTGISLVAPGLASAASATPHGLKGEYYTTSAAGAYDFHELKATVTDPAINFPDLVPTLKDLTGRGEQATARWTGKITPQFSEAYTFSMIGDNGFRLWVNGSLIIDNWVNNWDVEQTAAPVLLQAGTAYDLKVEYFQATGGANLFLRWASASQPKQIVPDSAFTPPDGYEIYPVTATIGTDGQTLDVTFEDTVGGVSADLLASLKLSVDAKTWPLTSATVLPDLKTIRVTLGAPVAQGSRARLVYDGAGALTVGGQKAPALNVPVTNASTYRLTTPWTAGLDKDRPLAEYPRPQQVRKAWQNLNGRWQFAAAKAGEAPPVGKNLAEQIVVPYAVQSALSGLERREDHMFYRRTISVPKGWQVGHKNRLRLNFGAVDYQATVWVNGTKVAEHQGGYTAFSADITDALKGPGQQEIIVGVDDTTNSGNQPVGKQTNSPGGIFYTATSGIWQTVWMEPVPTAAIDTVVSTPNLKTGSAAVTVKSAGASPTAQATVVARDKHGKKVGMVTGAANAALTLPIPDAHLWSPDDPYLYDLVVTLKDKDKDSRDTVRSYVGMRSIEIMKVKGVNKIALNGKPTFLLSTLDQGFWPDGIYTPASYEAYTFDLQAHKDLGFNTVRKHIKVEPARWYYEADKLGLMVWQDFVSGFMNNEQARADWKTQARAEVEQLRSTPSVIGWIPFNEGWGEWDRTVTGQIADEVKGWDPSRIVNAHSGVNCCNSLGDSGKGDVIDWHSYVGPALPQPDATRAAIDGEHGGFGLYVVGHTWPGPYFSYSDLGTKEALTQAYVANTEKLVSPARCYLSGSVYTQISDVENEVNGIYTYDRKVLKMDGPAVKAVNEKVVAAGSSTGSEFPPGTPGLGGVGAWKLDENTGTAAADSSGYGHDATLKNGATWAPGEFGSAVQLNGSNQSVETSSPVLDTTGSYSVSAWVKLDSLPGNWGTAVSQDGKTGASPFFLQYGQGQFAFSFPGGPRASLAMTPELGHWYHLVGVRDAAGQTLKLYLDGKPVASVNVCGGDESTGSFAIGRGEWDGRPVDFWPGAVDQVQAFDRALTDVEVAALAAG